MPCSNALEQEWEGRAHPHGGKGEDQEGQKRARELASRPRGDDVAQSGEYVGKIVPEGQRGRERERREREPGRQRRRAVLSCELGRSRCPQRKANEKGREQQADRIGAVADEEREQVRLDHLGSEYQKAGSECEANV